MPIELIWFTLPIAAIAGWYAGRQHTIKECRRLFNLGTDLNRFYVEYTNKDLAFNEFKSDAIQGLNMTPTTLVTTLGRV